MVKPDCIFLAPKEAYKKICERADRANAVVQCGCERCLRIRAKSNLPEISGLPVTVRLQGGRLQEEL